MVFGVGTGATARKSDKLAMRSCCNKEGKRDSQMRSSKKGNQWYFGMKAHVGVDAESGLVHTAAVTPGTCTTPR
jgi:IS5 family transposase